MSRRLPFVILFVLAVFSFQAFPQDRPKLDPKIGENDIKLPHELEQSLLPHNSDNPTDYYRTTESLVDEWDGAVWDPYGRDTYTYDVNNNLTEVKTELWDGSAWEAYSRVTYGYDNGIISVYTYQSWNGSQWLNNYRYSYTYDSWGYYTVFLQELGDSLSWDNYYRYLYYRDDVTHKQDSVLIQSWDGSNWDNVQITKYQYNQQGKDSIRTTSTWSGTEWELAGRSVYTHDNVTNSYSYIYQDWSGSDWVDDYRYSYTYDSNNLYLGRVYQTWDGFVWVYVDRIIYNYTAQNQYSDITYQDWDGATWIGDYRYLYEYDSNGNYDKYTYQDYNMGNWVNSSLYDYLYDSNDNQTELKYQTWDGTIWVNFLRYRYFYELVSGVEEESIVNDFNLYNNYPNPFNPSTKIEFVIPQKSNVVLKIYDILGKEIATLLNSEMENGNHSINFNAENLSSGVYFYKIDVTSSEGNNSFSETKKMLLMK